MDAKFHGYERWLEGERREKAHVLTAKDWEPTHSIAEDGGKQTASREVQHPAETHGTTEKVENGIQSLLWRMMWCPDVLDALPERSESSR